MSQYFRNQDYTEIGQWLLKLVSFSFFYMCYLCNVCNVCTALGFLFLMSMERFHLYSMLFKQLVH